MAQDPHARLQAQRNQLKSQLEGFLKNRQLFSARERIDGLCAIRHAPLLTVPGCWAILWVVWVHALRRVFSFQG